MEEEWRKIKRNHDIHFLDKFCTLLKYILRIYVFISYRMPFTRSSLNFQQLSYLLKEDSSYSDTMVFSIKETGKLLS